MMRHLICPLTLLFLPSFALAGGDTRKIEFNRDIRPILSDHCYLCHGPAKATRKADLRFDVKEEALADLGGYRAIVPGKVEESHLWLRITSKNPAKQMPPPKANRPLSARQIDLLKQWINEGAAWQEHWSFIAPKRPALAVVKNNKWVKNGIDHFVLARLEQIGLEPSAEASRETLIRRVTFDLTGLPPTITEIEEFLGDQASNAYEKVVDRLLASPRYGERMVLDWLDAARYSDTNGYQTDGTRAMWPWRDWVVDALNKNMPYDQFTIEQIAGDMLPNPSLAQKIATGLHRNHMINGEGGRIAEESRVDYVVDRVDTTATVWLGLTAGCARCHDHKYDPISQKEYYQLYAYFNNVAEVGGVDRRNSTAAPTLELPTEEQSKKIGELKQKIADQDKQFKAIADKLLPGLEAWEKNPKAEKLPEKVAAALKVEPAKRSAEQKKSIQDHFLSLQPEAKKLQQEIEQIRKTLGEIERGVVITMILEERKEPRDSFVLLRGVYDKYGEKVSAALPKALPPLPQGVPNTRLGLAKWLVDRSNPLTARVTVNRYWQTFFGAGLVKTMEDFGSQGDPPSHPDLLDWLAVEFKDKWDVKALHRLIVTSATYRQSSRVTPAILEKDPDNRLLTRGPRLRLTPFFLRDQALALSGLLVGQIGGPPVRPYQPPGLWEDFSFNQIRYEQDKGEKLYRRSMYTFWRRSIGPPNMFDTTARQVCTVRQSRTNSPLHALVLLNDVTFVEAARVWAEKLMKEQATPDKRLTQAFRQATARYPTAAEQKILLSGYQRVLAQFKDDKAAAEKLVSTGEWPRDHKLNVVELAATTAVLNMIMNLDEVITKE